MGRGREGRLQAGRQGAAARKKLCTRYCPAHPDKGEPASPRRAGTCRCHLCKSGARAGAGTYEVGRLGRGAMAGGEAAPQWRRRRGEEQPRRAPGGERSLRIPRPRRRHLAIASPTGSAARLLPFPLGRPSPVRSHGNGRARGPRARAPPAPGRAAPPELLAPGRRPLGAWPRQGRGAF